MAAGLDAAGFPSAPTRATGTEYTLPDGSKVRLMQPSGQAPLRACSPCWRAGHCCSVDSPARGLRAGGAMSTKAVGKAEDPHGQELGGLARPEDGDVVGPDRCVNSDERGSDGLGLRDEQAVEGVPVMHGQRFHGSGVEVFDARAVDREGVHPAGDVTANRPAPAGPSGRSRP